MPTVTFILLAIAALLVPIGSAFFNTGLVRSKNAAGATLRAITTLCVSVLAFWAIGGALLLQQKNDWLFVDPGLLFAWNPAPEQFPQLVFYLVLGTIAAAIVPGVVAERSRFGVPVICAALLAGLVVPVAGHWVWFGWLHYAGFTDVAGASVLHWTGGLMALMAAILVGPRSGKYNRDGSSNAIPGHSLPLVSMGVLLMFVGFVPCVVGAGLFGVTGLPTSDARAALNVLLAGCCGGLVSLIYGYARYGKPELYLTLDGLLGALVAISAGAGTMPTPAAAFIGAVAGLLVSYLTLYLDLRWHIDDPSGGIAVHAGGALWGTLAVGIFTPGSLLTRLGTVFVQALGLAAIGLMTLVLTAAVLLVLRRVLRAKEADEFDGLDLAEHDINAYPDFQQTMIKSYHLREA